MNGCFSREPFNLTTKMQDGWVYVDNTRLPHIVEVPFRMSKTCQFKDDPMGYGQQDKNCTGCKHKEAHEA